MAMVRGVWSRHHIQFYRVALILYIASLARLALSTPNTIFEVEMRACLVSRRAQILYKVIPFSSIAGTLSYPPSAQY
jgi:hypothetical protein